MAAFILIGSSSAIAQSTVIGKVVDENDAPLIGATVIVPGTSTGTGTDAAGNFSLKVDAGTQSVEISFIGYVTETREIKGGGRIDLGTIIIGKTKCAGIQNQMRLFGSRISPKRKATKISHTHKKTPFERQSKAIRTVFCIRPAPPHSPKYPPSNRDACARSS